MFSLSARRVDLAITVADELPSDIRRAPLFHTGFTCVYDSRRLKLGKKLSREQYLALDHVLVSYNGDLRGIVEDYFGLQRRVRVSVPTFGHVAPALDDTAVLATVPMIVARHILRKRLSFRTVAVPLPLTGTPLELLWRNAQNDDEAVRFIREHVVRIAKAERDRAGAVRPGSRKS